MAEGINGVALGCIAAGGVFVYGGLKGKSPLAAALSLIQGQSPASAVQSSPIGTGITSSTGTVTAGAAATDSQVSTTGAGRAAVDPVFKTWGWTKAGRAGAIANLEAESGLRTNNPGDGGTSNGIAQWHAERWTAMVAFAHAMSPPRSEFDLGAQLAFLKHELTTGYPYLWGLLRLSTDPGYVASQWCHLFERPANVEQRAAERAANARVIYGQLT